MKNPTKQDFWAKKNVFVTGCTGLLGSWMTQRLMELGAKVTGLVRDRVPHSILYRQDIINRINVAYGELEDMALLERTLNEYEITTVFHLAAQTIVPTANRSPLSTFESNVRGTWNLLEACRRVGGVETIIVASSDKAYGDQERLPYTEEAPLQGRYPYDVSKSCVDLIAQSFHATFGLPLCITRCGNFFGGGDLNFNRIIPGTIRSLYQGEEPVIRSSGAPVRDYIYIQDAVKAYLLLAEKACTLDIHGQAFNFGYEKQVSVLKLVEMIGKLMKRTDLEPKVLNEAEGEIKDQYLCSDKAGKILGWKPAYSLEKGLKETIDWYGEFFKTTG